MATVDYSKFQNHGTVSGAVRSEQPPVGRFFRRPRNRMYFILPIPGQALTVNLSEVFTISHNLTKDVLKHLTEHDTFAHSLTKQPGKHFSQVITITETITKDILKHLTENVTWQETLSKDIVKHLTENWTWTDTESHPTGLIRRITFLTLRSMLQTHDILGMENDLIGTGITKLETDEMAEDLIATGINKQDVDSMEKDSDNLQPDS